jgi:hypothetical protein
MLVEGLRLGLKREGIDKVTDDEYRRVGETNHE